MSFLRVVNVNYKDIALSMFFNVSRYTTYTYIATGFLFIFFLYWGYNTRLYDDIKSKNLLRVHRERANCANISVDNCGIRKNIRSKNTFDIIFDWNFLLSVLCVYKCISMAGNMWSKAIHTVLPNAKVSVVEMGLPQQIFYVLPLIRQ